MLQVSIRCLVLDRVVMTEGNKSRNSMSVKGGELNVIRNSYCFHIFDSSLLYMGPTSTRCLSRGPLIWIQLFYRRVSIFRHENWKRETCEMEFHFDLALNQLLFDIQFSTFYALLTFSSFYRCFQLLYIIVLNMNVIVVFKSIRLSFKQIFTSVLLLSKYTRLYM